MEQQDITTAVLENSSNYVTQLFREQQPVWAVYHDLLHTIETFNGCLEIGIGSGLSKEELEIICISAWFHDTGYLFTVEEHEERSSEIALNFLEKNGYPGDKINTVINCILATKTTVDPQDLLESVICDSDLISLGKSDYFETNDLLRVEMELRQNIKISEHTWLERSLTFLSAHKFYTDYARLKFNPQLEINLKNLQKKIDAYNS
jgi:uncharacterized protein